MCLKIPPSTKVMPEFCSEVIIYHFFIFNSLMPGDNKKVTHTWTNLQLNAKRSAAGLFNMCDLFVTTR